MGEIGRAAPAAEDAQRHVGVATPDRFDQRLHVLREQADQVGVQEQDHFGVRVEGSHRIAPPLPRFSGGSIGGRVGRGHRTPGHGGGPVGGAVVHYDQVVEVGRLEQGREDGGEAVASL